LAGKHGEFVVELLGIAGDGIEKERKIFFGLPSEDAAQARPGLLSLHGAISGILINRIGGDSLKKKFADPGADEKKVNVEIILVVCGESGGVLEGFYEWQVHDNSIDG